MKHKPKRVSDGIYRVDSYFHGKSKKAYGSTTRMNGMKVSNPPPFLTKTGSIKRSKAKPTTKKPKGRGWVYVGNGQWARYR